MQSKLVPVMLVLAFLSCSESPDLWEEPDPWDDPAHPSKSSVPSEAPGAVSAAGQGCGSVTPVDALPYSAWGSTTAAPDDFATGAGCGRAASVGGGLGDVVYALTVLETGVYTIEVSPSWPGPGIAYVVTDCADIAASCVAVSGDLYAEPGFAATLEARRTYYLIVDGRAEGFDEGPFDIVIAGPCQPACAGRACGDDGCLGTCGACGPGELCSDRGACSAPVDDTCDDAYPVGALPFSIEGNTAAAMQDYGHRGTCPGDDYHGGFGSRDQVYRFTAPDDGWYLVTLQADFDSKLYVVTDCSHIDGTCLGGQDAPGPARTELVTLDLQAEASVYIVVDGYSNTRDASGAYSLAVVSVADSTIR